MSATNPARCGRGPFLPTPHAVTRSARRASNSANVPRPGLRPSLLLDFTTLDTQHAPLVTAGYQRSHIGLGADFLAKPQVRDSDPKPGRTGTVRPHIASNPHHFGSPHLLATRERLARPGVLLGDRL